MDGFGVISVGILTISDRCSRGLAEDLSGAVLEEIARREGWRVDVRAVAPDEKKQIARVVRQWCDKKKISLVLTTGGTGLGPRDVTPEAVAPLLDKQLPGFGELMRISGRKKTPLADLSRSQAWTRGETLVLNLPGSPKGAEQSLRAVLGLVAHALSILDGGGHGKRK